MNKKFWKKKIGLKLLQLMVVALIISAVVGFSLYHTALACMDYYFDHSDYLVNQDQKYVNSFQKYVKREKLSSKDWNEITDWVQSKGIIYLNIYTDSKIIYDSAYPGAEIIESDEIKGESIQEGTYEIEFSDITAKMYLYGMYEYNFYNLTVLIGVIFSFLLFFFIVILGIKRYVKYIQQLEREITILEGGNLEYQITVKGEDELASLAKSLDDMRKSFRDKVETDEQLKQANRDLITAISHDIRTPLTTLMIYIEILRNRKYQTREQMEEYINKVAKKGFQIKQLTDNMFEYFLVSKEEFHELERPQYLKQIFNDPLSDVILFLKEKDFQVEEQIVFKELAISVAMDYILRIFDNIISNIVKYADKSEPVVISTLYEDDRVGIAFSNTVFVQDEKVESTQLGIQNIRNMMEKMHGSCEIKNDDINYSICLWFEEK